MEVATPEMDSVEAQRLKRLFLKVDMNENGYIDQSELTAALRSCGQNPMSADVEYLIREASETGGSTITLTEFYTLMSQNQSYCSEQQEADVAETFKMLDVHGKGFISVGELITFITKSFAEDKTDAEVAALCKSGDINSDGQISQEEFAKIMMPPKRSSDAAAADRRLDLTNALKTPSGLQSSN